MQMRHFPPPRFHLRDKPRAAAALIGRWDGERVCALVCDCLFVEFEMRERERERQEGDGGGVLSALRLKPFLLCPRLLAIPNGPFDRRQT